MYRCGKTYSFDGEDHILYGDSVHFLWEVDGYPAFITVTDTRLLPVCEQFLAEMRCCKAPLGAEDGAVTVATVSETVELPAPQAAPSKEDDGKVIKDTWQKTASLTFDTVEAYVVAVSKYSDRNAWYAMMDKLVDGAPAYQMPEMLFYDHRLTVPIFPDGTTCTQVEVSSKGIAHFTVTVEDVTISLRQYYCYDAVWIETLLTMQQAINNNEAYYKAFTDTAGRTVYRHAETNIWNGEECLLFNNVATYFWTVDGYVWAASADTSDALHILDDLVTDLSYQTVALHIG